MKGRSLLTLAALVAAGCGGSGQAGQAGKGRIALRATWGGQARVIPTAALSIRVRVYKGATVVNEALLAKANPTTTFVEVPTGSVTVEAVAFPAADGSGNAMASGQVVKTIASDATTSVDLTMASTIDRLTVTPNPVNFLIAALFPRPLTVTAYDAANAVVLTSPTDFTYSSSNVALATVSSTGVVTGIALGTATITVTDSVSGKSGTTQARILSF